MSYWTGSHSVLFPVWDDLFRIWAFRSSFDPLDHCNYKATGCMIGKAGGGGAAPPRDSGPGRNGREAKTMTEGSVPVRKTTEMHPSSHPRPPTFGRRLDVCLFPGGPGGRRPPGPGNVGRLGMGDDIWRGQNDGSIRSFAAAPQRLAFLLQRRKWVKGKIVVKLTIST